MSKNSSKQKSGAAGGTGSSVSHSAKSGSSRASDNRIRHAKYMLRIYFPVIILTVALFMVANIRIVDLCIENMSMQSDDSAALIDSYMQEIVGDMEDVRELIERNCSTDEEVREFVISTENYGVFGGVYTGDNTGFYVGSTPWDIPDDYDPTSRPWYVDGRDSRDFVFGEPYLDASVGKMCVSVSARMDADDDSIVRVVAADIYLDYMDNIVHKLVSSSELDGALILTDEMIVADSSGECTGEIISSSTDFNKLISDSLDRSASGVYTIVSKNVRYYVSVGDIGTTGWKLVTFERRRVMLHDLRVIEMIMSMAALLVGALLFIVMLNYGREVSEVEQRANRAKTEFISRISHDIRTPIGQVLNLTEFAKADKGNPEKLDEDLDRIDSSGRFLLSLINDVLDVSQIESGLMDMHPVVTTYDEYMKDIRNVMLPMCENKGLRCEIDTSGDVNDLPDMYCDTVRLKQITLNLISNAVKYTPYGGSITYISESTVAPYGGLRFGFTIRDTGVGMTEEFMEHMFEKFTRDTENKLRDSTQMGSGLGLYLVKNMIELMGGTISYESKQGEGTSVTVCIDMEKAPEAVQMTAATAAEDDGRKEVNYDMRVLLAEDNELNAEIAMRILEELGVTAEHAADGEEAVSMFKDSNSGYYRVIFMDIQMPKMNGFEATRAIRKLDRADAETVPIVAMTADAFKDAEEESKASGMTGFITKPLIIDDICRVLDSVK